MQACVPAPAQMRTYRFKTDLNATARRHLSRRIAPHKVMAHCCQTNDYTSLTTGKNSLAARRNCRAFSSQLHCSSEYHASSLFRIHFLHLMIDLCLCELDHGSSATTSRSSLTSDACKATERASTSWLAYRPARIVGTDSLGSSYTHDAYWCERVCSGVRPKPVSSCTILPGLLETAGFSQSYPLSTCL